MTNEELDRARAEQAWSDHYKGDGRDPTVIAARLAREGWTPPVPVDPDLAEAEAIWFEGKSPVDLALAGIKRGRALAAAEAKPGLVWVKHDGSRKNPLDRRNSWILVNRAQRGFGAYYSSNDAMLDWRDVTHYAVITPPEEK